ncbi:hypothetical protein LOD99_1251 [Oopsacas minuta]|uniref:MD-2-related lipid-recognition domain-containing protein n=1 Tax=Oopsacas minuta TaxID=111878 RepID=A0AAV7K701_9METZ|nr:hypothetical protein LOD99_1251 [Oopsacas minuta]
MFYSLAITYLLCIIVCRGISEGDISWRNCNSSWSVANVLDVSFNPNPPKAHHHFIITTRTEFRREVSDGQMALIILHEGEPVLNQTMQFCEFSNDIGLPCPIIPGIHTKSTQVYLFWPEGSYIGKLTGWDSHSQLVCVEFHFEVDD